MKKDRKTIYAVAITFALIVGFFQMNKSFDFIRLNGKWCEVNVVQESCIGRKVEISSKFVTIIEPEKVEPTVYRIKRIKKKHIKPTMDLGHGGSIEYTLKTDKGELKILQTNEKQLDHIVLTIIENENLLTIPLDISSEALQNTW